MSIKTEIEWFDIDKMLPTDNYESILIYYEYYNTNRHVELQHSHICEAFMDGDRKINIKFPDNEIWENDMDDGCIKIKYWAYLPELE